MNMNLGLVGLLGLLQVAAPQQQDTSRQNFSVLRNSIISYLIQDNKRDTSSLFFPMDENIMKLVTVVCNNGFYRFPDENIFSSTGFCRTIKNKPDTAFVISGGNL